MISPYRSVLYLPGSKERVLEKARNLAADALIFDLEDAVAPDEKIAARELVAKMIKEGGYGSRKLLVRVNGENTEWGVDDVKMALALEPDGILLPKVESAELVQQVASHIQGDRTKIWAMMETPKAVLHAEEIAASSDKLDGFVLGTNDLAKELRAAHVPGREPLLSGISMILCAARAYDKVCVDGVFNAFKDEEGLRAECLQGLHLGMDGKTLIHPAQIDITNEIFAPDQDALDLSHRQVEAYEAAIAEGQAVAVVDGRIVENLHVETAKRLIALDEAIRKLSNDQN